MGRGGHKKKVFGNVLLKNIPLYQVWSGIKSRCYNPKTANYKYYGAKGIGMCEEWRNDFMSFYNWCLANGWQKGLTIDRYPNDKGNYEPGNCRIATMQQQCDNRKLPNPSNNFKGINEKRKQKRLNNDNKTN